MRLLKQLSRLAALVLGGAVATAALADLRPLNTDRPDFTESPFTVDAGHSQLEMDFAYLARGRTDGSSTQEFGVAPFNLRLGLLSDLEAGVFIAPYVRRQGDPALDAGAPDGGFGDLTLRLKFNFWGNDGGTSAFGLIVDLQLPTAAHGLGDGKVEGGLILPVAYELPDGWSLSAMTEVDLRAAASGALLPVWVNSASLDHDLFRDTSGYIELTSAAGPGPHVATLDVGAAWKLNANTQLDAGVNFGLSRTADAFHLFSGLSRRF